MEELTVKETDVAAAMGLPIKTLRGLRDQHLTELEFGKKDGAVFYSPGAAAKLQAALQVPLEPIAPPDVSTPGEEGDRALVGIVTRTWPNPRIVGIRVGEKDGRLRVRDSEKFVKGMVCPVRLEREPDLYVLTCRSPRWKGKF